jgi:phosphohistidine swiveling domain-containing protein
VVSVQHATERIPDGAIITVDGATGTVTIDEL